MEKVFEPSELELWDVQGDPNRVIEVQGKIDELLRANRQRQLPLQAEIASQGAWALPGVINATYIWMNDIKEPQKQKMLAELMADLARGNTAATDLLFRAGILETPFPVPRAICSQALTIVNWQPDELQTAGLRKKIDLAKKLGDSQTVLDLYGLLLKTGSQADLTKEALQQCVDWTREKCEEAGTLLKLLVDHDPSQVVDIVSAVFKKTVSCRQEKKLAETLLRPLRPIPPEWLENDTILRISREALSKSPTGRLTIVEYLWSYAVSDCGKKAPDRWTAIMTAVSEKFLHEENKDILRYWFEAVGEVNVDYIVQQSRAEAEPFGIMAALQLFFLSNKHDQAKRGLGELKNENPDRYKVADNQYSNMISRSKEEGSIQQQRKAGEITVPRPR